MEVRQIDQVEETTIEKFVQNECGCSLSCSKSFSKEEIQKQRDNMFELESEQKDLVILSIFQTQLSPGKQKEKITFTESIIY